MQRARHRRTPGAALIGGWVVLSLLAVRTVQAQSFEPLPSLVANSVSTAIWDVSGDGTVAVGEASNDASRQTAVAWTNGQIQDLGYVVADRPLARASGISGDGKVAAGYVSYFPTPSGAALEQATRWIRSPQGVQRESLGYLGAVTLSRAFAASGDGSVVVGRSHTGDRIEAFRWHDGVMSGIGFLNAGPVGAISEAFDVSADGAVVVGRSQHATTRFEAFRWEDDQMVGLGFHDGSGNGWESSARSVSANGEVVVGSSQLTSSPTTRRAFRWESGQMAALPLSPDCLYAEAFGVSRDGGVVVGTERCADSTDRAFLWTPTGGTRPLREVLTDDLGLDLSGWTLLSATGVSADGRVVVGAAVNAANPSLGIPYRATLRSGSALVVNVAVGTFPGLSGDESNDPASAAEDRCDVDRSRVDDQCTLRAALELANARGGDRVTFDVPGDGVPEIRVFGTELPTLFESIEVDGTTQPGGWVEVVGPGQDASAPEISGLTVGGGSEAGSGSTIRGLVIHGFRFAGIQVRTNGCTIQGNRIGTDSSGTLRRGNGFYDAQSFFSSAGLWVEADETRIIGNVIAGNTFAPPTEEIGGTDVFIKGNRNVLEGNRIGVGADGQPIALPGMSALHVGVFIGGKSTQPADNRIGGPGAIGMGGSCANATCNAIQGHEIEILLGLSTPPYLDSGPRNVISGNVIGLRFPTVPGARQTQVGILGLVCCGNDTRVAFNQVNAAHNGIDLRQSDTEVLGNFVDAGHQADTGDTLTRDYFGAILVGDDAQVTLNTVQSRWNAIVVGARSTVTGNRLSGQDNILVQSAEPQLLARDNVHSCALGQSDQGVIYLGGRTNNADPVLRSRRRNDWGDIDGYQNAPVIVASFRQPDGVHTVGYVRGNASASNFAIDAHTCGGGVAATLDVASTLGRTDFELVFDDPSTEFVYTATMDDTFTSEATFFGAVAEDRLATIDMPSIGSGSTASALGADLTVTGGGRARDARAAGTARLFVTRYDGPPSGSLFDDTAAPASGGALVHPDAVAPGTWVLRDLGLSRESIDPNTAATFDVCFATNGIIARAALDAVVLVQRGGEVGPAWTALPTTRAVRDGTRVLCAHGLDTLGEFGFGAAGATFETPPALCEELAGGLVEIDCLVRGAFDTPVCVGQKPPRSLRQGQKQALRLLAAAAKASKPTKRQARLRRAVKVLTKTIKKAQRTGNGKPLTTDCATAIGERLTGAQGLASDETQATAARSAETPRAGR